MKDASSSPREIMKGPDIKPCGTSRGTAPKKESQTDVEGTCCRLISHACSRSLYMRTVFGINQLSSIHACHFIRICIFPVINMSLIIESDPFYWLNWAYFVYGMQFLGIYFFKSHGALHQGRWDDKGTAGEGVMVTCKKKGVSKNSTVTATVLRRWLLRLCSKQYAQNLTFCTHAYLNVIRMFPHICV